ncbi:hypothetical protein [Polaribacter sp.]|uniref:hypothetical protein n=1 Tax=Polaribacter sp. TaxID=1920175 RepID=UPI003EF749AC
MKLNLSTYRTFSGVKEVLEIPDKKETQWIIFEKNKPKYFVDFFDLETESNAMMNSLVLCSKRSLDEVLQLINKKNNIQLSIPKISKLRVKKKIKFEIIEMTLPPLPEKWLSYYL